MNIQAFVVDDFNNRSQSLLSKLWSGNTSQGAIAEKDVAVVGFCELCCFSNGKGTNSHADGDAARIRRGHWCGNGSTKAADKRTKACLLLFTLWPGERMSVRFVPVVVPVVCRVSVVDVLQFSCLFTFRGPKTQSHIWPSPSATSQHQ
jgi:hypothetical protein